MLFLIETLRLGMTNLALHKLRSLLTCLGIILGVAAVIVMVAIGEGNKQAALARIRQLGANNIIVQSVKPAEDEGDGTEARQRVLDYGVRRADFELIKQTINPIQRIVPLRKVGAQISRPGFSAPPEVAAFGTTPELLKVTSLRVARGRYITEEDMALRRPVVVIGASVADQLFQLEDPLDDNTIEIDGQLFTVIGVLRPVGLAGGAGSALVGRDLNFDIHMPLTTSESKFDDLTANRATGSFSMTKMELWAIYIQTPRSEQVLEVADAVRRAVELEHAATGDVKVIVPRELLEQERSQRLMMDTLLVAIAAISLLVGGIGIMNIMLATVTERTREIGIRRAVGATRRHIIAQFLAETTVLSGIGGLLGVGVGLAASWALGLIHKDIPGIELPQVRMWAIIASFLVATAVGIIFGLYPAVKASQQDPIVALRHD